MKPLKLITIIFIIALLVWGIQYLVWVQQNRAEPERIKAIEINNRKRITLEHKQNLRTLEQEYEKKKYLATGATVFDRIYNSQDQSIIDLIRRIASEALPDGWSLDVKVEEFTNFILLIYLPHNDQEISPDQIVSHLSPVLKYCGWMLSDVAVFDRKHKSYLFFDKAILNKIKKHKKLSKPLHSLAKQNGKSFTRFNSVTIECIKYKSHLFLPLEVIGTGTVITTEALFDTGASTTTLSANIVSETGSDDLKNATHRRFDTVNGTMSCPIVKREVNVGGFHKRIEIAVNQRDELNLLGVNFFEGMDYIVDFQNSAIYVWEK